MKKKLPGKHRPMRFYENVGFKMILRSLFVGLLVILFQINVYSQEQKTFTKSFDNASVEKVFKEIQSESQYRFVFMSEDVKSLKKITKKFKNATVREIVSYCLEGSNLAFEMDENTIIIHPKEKTAQSVITKQMEEKPMLKVSGRVVDADNFPLPGATVLEVGTLNGITTDTDGKFEFEVAGKQSELKFSYIGFEVQQLAIGDQTEFNIVLRPEATHLSEVVVVGYGTTMKKDLTGTVSTVKADEIQEIKAQTIDQTLAGKMSGVFVQNRGGQPGAGAFVHIRGLSQIRGDNQPLYVVDGVPITTTPNSESLGIINYGERENPLLAINPDDIERIDVLKDASAAAIYGSRAANGVIIVTTKRGKRNQAPRFSFNMSTTIQNPVDTYDYLSGPEWVDWLKEKEMISDPDYFGDADTDWQDLIINDNALWTQYSFNVSGGSDKVNYLVSLGYQDQDGVMIENNFKRYNFSTNLDASVTDRLKLGASMNYNYSINKRKGFSYLAQGAFRPDLPAYNEDASYSRYDGPYGEQYTLIGDGMGRRNKAISQNMFGSVYGEVKIIEGLKFKSQVNIGLNNDKTEVFASAENNLFYALYYSRPGASLNVQRNTGWSTSFVNTLNFNRSFNEDHKIDAVAGISWDRSRYDAESQDYRGFPDDEILVDINSANFFDAAGSESLEQGLNSIFGRINYVYKDKYLATFTARRDGSTKFGPDNQFGFFPSGALAWNIHNEDFMKKFDFVTNLKLRASLGRTGSDNLPSFTYLAYYKSLDNAQSVYDGVNGIVVSGVPNTGIRWEETDQFDVGLEFGLFNNRLNGEIVYFEKNTSGIILFEPIPSQTGSTTWNTNVGDVSNNGWEFVIGGDIFREKDFTWNSSLNISFIKNEVEKLYNGNVGYQTGIIEGEPIGTIIGYDVIKIAQTQDEIDALNDAAGGTYQSTLTQPGDYIFRDINGDGVITTDDRGPLGDINPDYYGGWNNRITYKNWDLSMNWSFAHGAQREYEPITNLYYVDVEQNVTSIVFDAWTPENTDAKYARHGSRTNGWTATSRSIVDASYIKLRSLSIGYSLPKHWFTKIGITNAKITLRGNNLITISNYPGLDPEDVTSFSFAGRTTGYASDDGRSYPNVRSFTVSLNITF